VDALDKGAMNAYLDNVVQRAGKLDIVSNAVGLQPDEYDNGKETIEVAYEKSGRQAITIMLSRNCQVIKSERRQR
jgi:hypothetical protein